MGESQMKSEVRDKLIDKVIKIELYHEVPETIEIDKRQYFLLRLPIDSFYNYNLGDRYEYEVGKKELD